MIGKWSWVRAIVKHLPARGDSITEGAAPAQRCCAFSLRNCVYVIVAKKQPMARSIGLLVQQKGIPYNCKN
jgi:hypothetical protein